MLSQSTRNVALLFVLGLATIAFGLTRATPVAGQATPDA